MPRSGAGVYSKPANATAVSGTKISSTMFNGLVDDLVTDANAARPVVAGGTGATTASAARQSLGLEIGVDIMAYDAGLQSIASLTPGANGYLYTTGLDTWARGEISAFGRALVDDVDAATARATLGLGGLSTLEVIDEDDMVTNSATRPPSQQSTKAYADSLPRLGVGQTWQDVSGSRVVSTTYQNTTGRPIQVHASGSAGSSGNFFQISTDGSTWLDFIELGNSGRTVFSAVLPNNQYYRLSGGNIEQWWELR